MNYRGRFAPTASGPLHAGSLMTALAGWLQARAAGGKWLLRIDDLDVNRCKPEFAAVIQRQLEAHGLIWDEQVRFQSEHLDEYRTALEVLRADGRLYACTCSRASLLSTSIDGIDGAIYAGTCRNQNIGPEFARAALRLRSDSGRLLIDDSCQGLLKREIQSEIGDFVVRRSDGQIAYQLACVVDEAAQGITEIVRGSDLIGSSFRQKMLRTILHSPEPSYLHIPVLVEESGRKISKQNHAAGVEPNNASGNIFRALQQLGQSPPDELSSKQSISATLQWAVQHWKPRAIPSRQTLKLRP